MIDNSITSLTNLISRFKEFDDRHRWLIDADLTYCSGRFLLIKEDFFFRASGGFLLHQAAEKYLKVLRRLLCPEYKYRRHLHQLKNILQDITSRVKITNIDKLIHSIEKIDLLWKFRYPDLKAAVDIDTMEMGLEATDYLVMCVRKEIEYIEGENLLYLTDKAIKRYVEGIKDNDAVLNLLIDSLLRKNSCGNYWIKHLSDIDEKIDCNLKRYQG